MKQFVCGILVLLGTVVGCGGGTGDKPKVAPVAGVLKFKGVPVAEATVVFYPEKGPAAVGKTDAKGAFQVKTNGQLGAPVGKNKVTVATAQTNAEPPPADGKELALLQKPTIPTKYSDQQTTDLIVDVTAEGNKDLVLDLTE